jgi:hypothetical protein
MKKYAGVKYQLGHKKNLEIIHPRLSEQLLSCVMIKVQVFLSLHRVKKRLCKNRN